MFSSALVDTERRLPAGADIAHAMRRLGPRSMFSVALIAVATRLVIQLALGLFGEPEFWEYEEVARNVLAGRGFVSAHNGSEWHAASPPLFAFILVVLFGAFGPTYYAVGALNIVLGIALSLTICAVARRVLSPSWALVAGVGAATHPGLLVYSAKVHPLALDAVLAAAALLLALWWRESSSRTNAILIGVLGGLAALERPPLVLVLFAVIMLSSLRNIRAMKLVIVAALLTGAIASPWIIRNQVVLGRASLTPTYGELLWRGNSPGATGGALASDGRPLLEASPEMRERVWGRPELEQDDAFRDAAFAWMGADPLRAARGFLDRMVDFWWAGDQTGALYPKTWFNLYLLYYAALVSAAIVGTGSLIRRRAGWLVTALFLELVIVSVVQSVFYVEGRHRWGVEALLFVPAVAGVAALAARARLQP